MSLRTLALPLGTSLLTLLLGACAPETPAPAKVEDAPEAPAPAKIEDARQISATVEAIDVATRMLQLRGEDGEQFTLEVSPEVRNLEQVKVGDRVVARYYESLAAELRRRGDGTGTTEAPVVDAAMDRAEAGEKPGAAVGTQTRATVRVISVDTQNNVVSFYGADGLSRTVPLRTPEGREFASKLKPGDEVELTYTEALAVSVEPAT